MNFPLGGFEDFFIKNIFLIFPLREMGWKIGEKISMAPLKPKKSP